MAITIPSSALHTSYQNDNLMNQYPSRVPSLTATGIYQEEIELLNTQVYQVDIFANWLSHKPKETPMLSILANLGAGDMVNQYFIHWWDEYEGTGLIDSGLYNLRYRDALGDSSGNPWAIGTAGEIGGKMMWQKCYLTVDDTQYTDAWTNLADSADIDIRLPQEYLLGNENMVPTDGTGLWPVEIQETGPQLVGSKKLVSLGYDRAASGKYAYSVGDPAKYITQVHSALKANEYKLEEFTSCNWSGTASQTVQSLSHVAGTSRAVYVNYSNMELLEMTDNDTGSQKTENVVNVKVDRFIWNSTTPDTFILVLDFAQSNIEFSASANILASVLDNASDATYDGWYKVVKSVAGSEITISDDDDTDNKLYAGDVFRFEYAANGGAEFSLGDATNEVVKIETGILMEEVNTSTAWTGTRYDGQRLFGLNVGTASVSAGGSTRMSKHLIINMFHDVPDSNSESEGFSVEEATGYTFTEEGKMNYFHILNDKPYGITTMRQGIKLRFRDNWTALRERRLSQYKKLWSNAVIWGKKKNASASESDGAFKGKMSGLLDKELFDINYLSRPMPVYDNNLMKYSDGGIVFMEWLDSIAKSLNYNAATGKYEGTGRTLNVSLEVIRYLKNTNAFIASNNSSNMFGALYTHVKGSESSNTLGLDVYKYDTTYGPLNFVHDPTLDNDTKWNFPRFLFNHRTGTVSPRYLIFGLDKNSIKLKTQASRPERLYGNLQPPNNPFVYKEGLSGSHSLEVRNEMNHGIIDVTPNNM